MNEWKLELLEELDDLSERLKLEQKKMEQTSLKLQTIRRDFDKLRKKLEEGEDD